MKHKTARPAYVCRLKSDRNGLYQEVFQQWQMREDLTKKKGKVYVTNFKIRLLDFRSGATGWTRKVWIQTPGGAAEYFLKAENLYCPSEFRRWLLQSTKGAFFFGGERELMMLIEDIHGLYFQKESKHGQKH